MATHTPPANRPACNPEFPFPPTPKLYYLRNKTRPYTNFIRAEISPRNYFLYELQNEPNDGLGCPGGWLFDKAWDHFASVGVVIGGIRGLWDHGTNLATVNQLTKNPNVAIQDAARQTWAIAQANKKGYSNVAVLDSDGSSGNYTSVDVVFLP